jgi:hypothetical protein
MRKPEKFPPDEILLRDSREGAKLRHQAMKQMLELWEHPPLPWYQRAWNALTKHVNACRRAATSTGGRS